MSRRRSERARHQQDEGAADEDQLGRQQAPFDVGSEERRHGLVALLGGGERQVDADRRHDRLLEVGMGLDVGDELVDGRG